jgi:hypothetical protein
MILIPSSHSNKYLFEYMDPIPARDIVLSSGDLMRQILLYLKITECLDDMHVSRGWLQHYRGLSLRCIENDRTHPRLHEQMYRKYGILMGAALINDLAMLQTPQFWGMRLASLAGGDMRWDRPLPDSIKCLYLGLNSICDLQPPISSRFLPPALTRMVVNNFYGTIESGVFPKTLTNLEIIVQFDTISEGFFPPELRVLKLRMPKVPILAGTFPDSLTSMNLLQCDQLILPGIIPKAVKKLRLSFFSSDEYETSASRLNIAIGALPDSLMWLCIDGMFKGKLLPGLLPKTLMSLKLNYRYPTIEMESLPRQLKHLHIFDSNLTPIPSGALPDLKSLVLPVWGFEGAIKLEDLNMKTLTALSLPSCFPMTKKQLSTLMKPLKTLKIGNERLWSRALARPTTPELGLNVFL